MTTCTGWDLWEVQVIMVNGFQKYRKVRVGELRQDKNVSLLFLNVLN